MNLPGLQAFSSNNWLECIGCGHRTNLLAERKFRCPSCGGLYDIVHDTTLAPPIGVLQNTFDERAKDSLRVHKLRPDLHSGVWRFKELVMPRLPDHYIVSLGEGNVPIVPAGKRLREWIGGNIELWLILEGMTPTGSFKDFGGTVMISVAKAAGISAIACSSTGDTSAMAAAYSAAAGIRCAVILPKGLVTPVQLAQPLVHGATVINLPGNFDDCMRVMQDLVRDYGVYPANSLNPSRIEGHQATVFLLGQYFGWSLPSWIVAPVGNGSNCSSIGKALRSLKEAGMNHDTRILGCQSEAACPLSRSWITVQRDGRVSLTDWKTAYQPLPVGNTSATAARIGDPVSRDKVMREIVHSNGAMQIASEQDLNEAVAICGKDGYFVCPQTGTALAGLRNAVGAGLIKEGLVAVVSTATGLKFTDSAATHLLPHVKGAADCRTETVAEIMQL